MAHVITDLCTQCGNCSEVCPVECIKKGDEQYYINPEECIDCAACVEECPEGAIFAEEDLPNDKKSFPEINASFFG
ncbi:MAG: indolepyruvate ferredoxin oxidoreductase subunit alpha [Candidatus Zhuqueibacterota bacterium]